MPLGVVVRKLGTGSCAMPIFQYFHLKVSSVFPPLQYHLEDGSVILLALTRLWFL